MQITVTLTTQDQQILEYDLLDVNQWVQDAVAGKLNNCKKRMIAEWQPIFMADPNITSLPADEDSFVAMILADPRYQNRAAREAAGV